MNDILAQYWPLILVALLIGIAVAWFITAASRKTKVERSESGDVLDAGAAPAKRNQALIDTPPAAAPSTPATPEPSAAPEPAPSPVPEAARDASDINPATENTAADDLTRIKGVGPKLSTLLQSMGITSYAQIAAWTDAEVERIDAQLGKFQGRIQRDNWTQQARFLASGDTTGYEDRFGKL
ncbi:MAG: hypothetical protein R3E21_12440 [Caenibius sp.]